jgi:nucleoside-diphosphate-sugar epimerase
MKILVTGGAGYVGSVVVPALLGRGHTVRVLDVLRRGGTGLIGCCQSPEFDFRLGDVCDPGAVAEAVEGVEAIVHLAALVGYPACLREPSLARLANVGGTQAVLDARKPGQKLVFASTSSVYGAVPDGVCTEAVPLSPVSLYGQTKVEAEGLVLAAGDSVSLRFATGYGVSPCMRDDLLVNNFVREAFVNHALAVYESHARRTFIHVRDMAGAIAFTLEEWNAVRDGVYNVGDDELSMTKKDLCLRLAAHLDFHLQLADFGTDLDLRDYEVSTEAFRRKGFHTEVSFEAGVRELVHAYRLLG